MGLFLSSNVSLPLVLGHFQAVSFPKCPISPRFGTFSGCFLPQMSHYHSFWDIFRLFPYSNVSLPLVLGHFQAVSSRKCLINPSLNSAKDVNTPGVTRNSNLYPLKIKMEIIRIFSGTIISVKRIDCLNIFLD
ncbi:hypothetical protein UACE39S_00383 [Ureibacillus acetophenoni]